MARLCSSFIRMVVSFVQDPRVAPYLFLGKANPPPLWMLIAPGDAGDDCPLCSCNLVRAWPGFHGNGCPRGSSCRRCSICTARASLRLTCKSNGTLGSSFYCFALAEQLMAEPAYKSTRSGRPLEGFRSLSSSLSEDHPT